jgi:hypothetical protein
LQRDFQKGAQMKSGIAWFFVGAMVSESVRIAIIFFTGRSVAEWFLLLRRTIL